MSDRHDDDLSRLYQKTRIEEPPMKLDSAILREARKAVEKKSGRNLTRWLAPLTSVALVMLTATLIIQMRKEQPALIAPPEPATKTTTPMKEQTPGEGTVMQEREMQDAAAPPPKRNAMEDVDRLRPRANEAMQKALKQEEAIGESRLGKAKELPTAGRADAPASSPVSSPASKPVSEAALEPDVWLEQIHELKRQGRDAEAAESLERFRLAYPDYVIPGELLKD